MDPERSTWFLSDDYKPTQKGHMFHTKCLYWVVKNIENRYQTLINLCIDHVDLQTIVYQLTGNFINLLLKTELVFQNTARSIC